MIVIIAKIYKIVDNITRIIPMLNFVEGRGREECSDDEYGVNLLKMLYLGRFVIGGGFGLKYVILRICKMEVFLLLRALNE